MGAPVTLVRKCTRKLGRKVGSSPRDARFCYGIVVSRTKGVGQVIGGLLVLGRLRFNSSRIRFRQFSVMGLMGNIVTDYSVLVRRTRTGVSFVTNRSTCM